MEDEKIEILAAWKKGDLFCSWKFRQKIGKDAWNEGKLNSQRPIHEDLRFAFAALEVHVPAILQEMEADMIPDMNADITGAVLPESCNPLVQLFTVTGIEYDREEESVSIIATKALDLGTMSFSTPFVKFSGTYKRAQELRILVDRLVNEVEQYIDGKQAPVYEQTDMFAGGGEGDTAPLVEGQVEKRKRGRPAKVKTIAIAPNTEGDGEGRELTDLEKANLGNGETEPLTTYFNPAAVAQEEPEL